MYAHPPSTPRSILKQQHSSTRAGCRSPDRPPAVHFPPSPSLTRVYAAHPSTAYDRSPIVVSPNACALPERGCPGRTYTLGDERPTRSSQSKRRIESRYPTSPTRSVGDDHTRSSESDESDSFVTPFDTPNTSLTPAPSISKPRIRSDGMLPTSPYYPEQSGFSDNYPPSYPSYRSSLDDAHKSRRRRSRDRSRERSYASDDCYKPFSPYSSHALREMDDGCLGGF
ncbi:hypothetical protein F5J12DRAFT_841496 [Pisolithus orientalis]|uniref:uncharacterized protein n=1 Tax=Pisolithus orientalis TaxID=936130 RepID=UPI002223F7D5|nr:uncharacterized protein F5J12DRAFT_841496 [Pisolithus orientalis]KAI6002209.1 hypothetical protein F5J12DRAFT_841496 [Pisolithus orientalis]